MRYAHCHFLYCFGRSLCAAVGAFCVDLGIFGRFYGRKAHLPGLAPFLGILRVSRAFRIILEFRAAEEGWKHFQKKIESFETFSKGSKAGKGTK